MLVMIVPVHSHCLMINRMFRESVSVFTILHYLLVSSLQIIKCVEPLWIGGTKV